MLFRSGRKRWLSECSGRALRQSASREAPGSGRGRTQPNPDSESQVGPLRRLCVVPKPLTEQLFHSSKLPEKVSGRRLRQPPSAQAPLSAAPRPWSCFRFPPVPTPPKPRPVQAPPRISGARARASAGGGGWGRTAGEIPRRGSRARPRPGPQFPPGPPGSAMIKAILIFNNHGKPRLSKFYQPYVSARRRRSGRRGSRWRPTAPSRRPPRARRGPSGAPAAARSGLSASGWVCRVSTSRRGAFLRRGSSQAAPPLVCGLGGFPAVRARPWRLPGAGPKRGRRLHPTCAREPTRVCSPLLLAAEGDGAEPAGLAAPPPRLPAFPA